MSTSERGLVVTVYYYGPPAVGIAAQRLRGFAEHLPEFGWDLLVIAPRDVHYHRTVPADSLLPPDTQLVRTPNPEPSRWFRGMWGRPGELAGEVEALDPLGGGPLAVFARRIVRNWLYVPDAQLLWIRPAASFASRAVRSAAPRRVVLHSSSVPYSSHLAARRVVRRTGVPWVAEYRDPWSTTPRSEDDRPAFRRWIDRKLDSGIVGAARALVVTSDATARVFREAFAGRMPPTHVVRNGFDPMPAVSPPGPSRTMTLVHSGAVHASPAVITALLEALARIWAREPESVRLDIYGPQDAWLSAVSAFGEVPFFRMCGIVPAKRMAGIVASASACLMLDPAPDRAIYVRGKLYEYLGARRPVVAAVAPGSETERLLREHGDPRFVRPLGVDAMERTIGDLLREHQTGTLQVPRVSLERVEPLTRRHQTRELARVFDSVSSPP